MLPKITVRTLIAWGAHDEIVHPSSVNVFTALMPNSEKTIFEECGHALPRECPDLLAQRYLAFLEREPGRAFARLIYRVDRCTSDRGEKTSGGVRAGTPALS